MKSQKLSGDPDRMSLKNRSTPGLRGQGDLAPAAAQLALEELQNKAYPSSDAALRVACRRQEGLRGGCEPRLGGQRLVAARGPVRRHVSNAILNRTNADYVASGRVTAVAVAPTCVSGNCRLWVGAAGGGVWRTDDALASTPSWTNVSGSFGTSAIGALTYDSATNTLYAGTGEQNASADSDAGVGIFKSTDGGDHWTLLPGSPAMSQANAVSAIVVSGSTLYVGTTYGVAGIAGVGGGAQPSFVPGSGAPKPGLWKSTDGGSSFSLMFDDSAGTWGINNVAVDSHGVVYISSVGKGIYRSSDGGATWEQVFQSATPANRTEFALTTVGGHTRIYIGDGGDGTTPTTGVYHQDSIDTATAATLITGGTNGGYVRVPVAPSTQSGRLTRNYCSTQCWYDNTVYSPPGNPDIVYVLGSFDYNNQPAGVDNGAAVLLSTDGGVTWSDVTRDSGDNQIHPDQHAIVASPSNPLLFFEGSDGGVMRSDGTLSDATARCAGVAPLGPIAVAICNNANKAVPTHLYNLNAGLSTLQFQNAASNPANPSDVMGGTQDNGTWEGTAGNANWPQTMYGDGGIAQFDVGNPAFRMNEFFFQYSDVNFQNGAAGQVGRGLRSVLPLRRDVGVLQAAGRGPGEVGHDLRRARQRLAYAGLRRQPVVPRVELPRVHHRRCNADVWRLRAARRSIGQRRDQLAERPDRVRPVRDGQVGRLRRGDRPRVERHVDAVDSNPPRPRLRLEERGRRGRLGVVHPDRRRLRTLAEVSADTSPLRQRHRRRPEGPEPRVRVLRRLQRGDGRSHAGSAGPRLRGHVQPEDGPGDLDVARQRQRPDR